VTQDRGVAIWALRVVIVAVALAIAAAGCAGAARSSFEPPTSDPAPRGAAKVTCEEVVPGWIPPGIELADRRLVPFSEALLGVEAEYLGDGVFLHFVSGGYLDDVLEPYDDLAPLDRRRAAGDPAQVMGGSFVGFPLFVVTWQVLGEVAPCSTRAVVAVGLTRRDFDAVVDDLTVRAHSGS
jgi:hypothetical protein